ncbi:hypothetical protein ACJW30_12G119600 [Castanea mollissima]
MPIPILIPIIQIHIPIIHINFLFQLLPLLMNFLNHFLLHFIFQIRNTLSCPHFLRVRTTRGRPESEPGLGIISRVTTIIITIKHIEKIPSGNPRRRRRRSRLTRLLIPIIPRIIRRGTTHRKPEKPIIPITRIPVTRIGKLPI